MELSEDLTEPETTPRIHADAEDRDGMPPVPNTSA